MSERLKKLIASTVFLLLMFTQTTDNKSLFPKPTSLSDFSIIEGIGSDNANNSKEFIKLTVASKAISPSGGNTDGNNNGGGGSDNIVLAQPPAVEPTPGTPVDLSKQVKEVNQVTVDVDKLDPANKTKFITGMTYNEHGYATYDNKYVIVCDDSLAKIGDNLVFTQPDGTKVDCIVGAVVDYSEDYQGTVSFIVNESWNAQSTSNLTFDMNNLNVLNNGQYVKA